MRRFASRRFSVARPSSMEEFLGHYRKSIEDPEAFWSQVGKDQLQWDSPFHKARNGTMKEGNVRYFSGGKLNVATNLVDKHVDAGRGDRVALYWEGDEPGERQTITYDELLSESCRLASLLHSVGVRKGDSVAIMQGQVPHQVYSMLACARLGAVQTVVFAGFSAEAVRDRVEASGARVVLTADEGRRGGKSIPLKRIVDDAVSGLDCVERVLVHRRTGATVPMKHPRDVFLDEALEGHRPYWPAEVVDSEHPLFSLYTSGSTGKPKGMLHSSAGYLVHATLGCRATFMFPDDPDAAQHCHASLADLGWIAQQTLGLFGPLNAGVSTVVFESIPNYPDASRYWEMVERLKVDSLFTAPTAVRALMKSGEKFVDKHDRSSLKVISVAGEPINPVAWNWLSRVVGGGRVPVADQYWMTEAGALLLATLPGIMQGRPGAAGLPFYGIKPRIEEDGALMIEDHWPSVARTIVGDHARYKKVVVNSNGHFVTGDAAKRDDDGYIWIKGRTDDVIVKAGHRVGTAEIESALIEDGTAVESAVVSIPHEVMGEQIVAFCIVPSSFKGNEEVKAHLKLCVKKKIGGIAVPDVVCITPDLPKTRSGKLLRRTLRSVALGSTEFGDISTLAEPAALEAVLKAYQKS